jgi:hypothetical protein
MKKHRKAATAEQKAVAQARRAELIARTLPLQVARKSGLLPWAELPTINACLELIYASETGQTEWKTFLGWKEAGFAVAKGEKGFSIWGRPIECEECEAESAPAERNTNTAERKFEFFPVSYLFHAGQVADQHGSRPTGYRAPNAFATELKALPLAPPAPVDAPASEGNSASGKEAEGGENV